MGETGKAGGHGLAWGRDDAPLHVEELALELGLLRLEKDARGRCLRREVHEPRESCRSPPRLVEISQTFAANLLLINGPKTASLIFCKW